MTNTKRAWSDVPDHVIVELGGYRHGMDLGDAADLHDRLGQAIVDALRTGVDPFEEWFRVHGSTPNACGFDKDHMRAAFKAGQEAGEKLHENH